MPEMNQDFRNGLGGDWCAQSGKMENSKTMEGGDIDIEDSMGLLKSKHQKKVPNEKLT